MKLLRDPLLVFLVAGLGIFAAYDVLSPAPDQPAERSTTIVVDQPALLRFIAYRTKNFAPGAAERRWEAASATERADLIERYIDEEVKFRTALRFGMDQDDYVIRSRLVQKVDFMGEGMETTASPDGEVEGERLARYYERHSSRYLQPAQVTFTHVFFSEQQRSPQEAWRLAQAALHALTDRGVPFSRAGTFGERFHYQLNYVERPYEDISAHFGDSMADWLFAQTASETRWLGPIRSDHGVHLVLLINTVAAMQPTLESVRGEVLADLRAADAAQRRSRFSADLRKAFAIEIAPGLRPLAVRPHEGDAVAGDEVRNDASDGAGSDLR